MKTNPPILLIILGVSTAALLVSYIILHKTNKIVAFLNTTKKTFSETMKQKEEISGAYTHLSKDIEENSFQYQNISWISSNSDIYLKYLKTGYKFFLSKYESFKEKGIQSDKVLNVIRASTILDNEKEVNYLTSFLLDETKIIKYSESELILNMIYKGTLDGDSPDIFHRKVKGVNNTLVWIETRKGVKFGGFTTQTWDPDMNNQTETTRYKTDNQAFVFTFNYLQKFTVSTARYAIIVGRDLMPIFGRNDIGVSKNYWRDDQFSASIFPYIYGDIFEDTKNELLTGYETSYLIEEMEIYEVVNYLNH